MQVYVCSRNLRGWGFEDYNCDKKKTTMLEISIHRKTISAAQFMNDVLRENSNNNKRIMENPSMRGIIKGGAMEAQYGNMED